MTQPNEKTPTFKTWDNPAVHPSTSTEQILERIAQALETIAEKVAGTNEKLADLREGIAILNSVIESVGGCL